MSRYNQRVSQLCHAIESGTVIPYGDNIQGLEFGGVSSGGKSRRVAREDHIHAVPTIGEGLSDILRTTVFRFEDFAGLDVGLNNYAGVKNNSTLASNAPANFYDSRGASGAYGVMPVTLSGGAGSINTTAAGFMSAVATTSTEYLCRRMRRFESRIRLGRNSAARDAPDTAMWAVGGFRSSIAQRVDLITDGIFFLFDMSSGSLFPNEWQCVCVNDGNTSRRRTHRGYGGIDFGDLFIDGQQRDSNGGFYVFLRMDITEDFVSGEAQVEFFMNDVRVATITKNVPINTRKFSMWGVMGTRFNVPTTTDQTLDWDYVLLLGDRVYNLPNLQVP